MSFRSCLPVSFSGCIMMTVLLCSGAFVPAAEYYVDNVGGLDGNPGDADRPFATIAKALAVLAGGDTLHLSPTAKPYNEKVTIRKEQAGTEAQPTVIDGHGATIDGRRRFLAAEWKDEGGGIFSRMLPNNAWPMDRQGCWSGDFPLVFFDGADGKNCRTLDELTPLSYYLRKLPPAPKENRPPEYTDQHNRLFIKLPPDTTPDSVNVETIGDAGVMVRADNVAVRNMNVRYVPIDCFSTFWSRNVAFDKIEGSFAMDQGISNHSSSATVSDSVFHHNAGCGIVDIVLPDGAPCAVTYTRCRIVDNVYRGGIEFRGKGGRYALVDCLVAGNAKSALSVADHATVRVDNCVFSGQDKRGGLGVSVRGGAGLEMRLSTVCGFREAFAWQADAALALEGNAVAACGVAYRLPFPGRFSSDKNYFADVRFALSPTSAQELSAFPAYHALGTHDRDSVADETFAQPLPPLRIPAGAARPDGQRFGAVLDPFAE